MKCLYQICFRKKDAWLTRILYLLHVIDKTIDWRISIFSCGSFERWTRNYIKFWIRSKAQLHRVLRGGVWLMVPPPHQLWLWVLIFVVTSFSFQCSLIYSALGLCYHPGFYSRYHFYPLFVRGGREGSTTRVLSFK